MGIKMENCCMDGRGEERIEDIDGNVRWYKDGRLHREFDPAVEWIDGRLEWFKEGLRHREDGPAVVDPCGLREWFVDGQRHREDGPAVIWVKDRENILVEWFLYGTQFTEVQFNDWREKKTLNIKLDMKLGKREITKRNKI